MATCTFFGHRDCPGTVTIDLFREIERLINTYGVDTFYVGNQGQFDGHVRKVLRQLANEYPHIRYAVVLAYMPGRKREYEDYSDTICPEGQEEVHPKYAIDRRNRWMLRQSQFVVCYLRYTYGGGARYVQMAQRQGKHVINLAKDGSAAPQ